MVVANVSADRVTARLVCDRRVAGAPSPEAGEVWLTLESYAVRTGP